MPQRPKPSPPPPTTPRRCRLLSAASSRSPHRSSSFASRPSDAILRSPSPINRVLKNDFLTTFSCKKPNDFGGQFFKTWLFQHPVNANKSSRHRSEEHTSEL